MSIQIIFETKYCDRCGGTGRMPYAAHNGVCFKCNGAGRCPTGAGKKARAAFDAWVAANATVRVADVVAGMAVRTEAMKRAATVQAVTVSGSYVISAAGERTYYTDLHFKHANGGVRIESLFASGTVVRALTQDDIRAAFATLPRKGATLVEKEAA